MPGLDYLGGCAYGGSVVKENELTVICDCGNREHQFALWYDASEPDFMCLEVHLHSYKSFLLRLKHAIKYVFGHKSVYGCFDETLIGFDESLRIAKFIAGFHLNYVIYNARKSQQ